MRASLYGPRRILPDAPAPAWGDAVWQGTAGVQPTAAVAAYPDAEALARGEEEAVLAAAGGLCTGGLVAHMTATVGEAVPWTAESPELCVPFAI